MLLTHPCKRGQLLVAFRNSVASSDVTGLHEDAGCYRRRLVDDELFRSRLSRPTK